MSDISNSNSSCSHKRRLSQIDDTIEYLTQEMNTLNEFVYKTEFECSLMTVKMKRQKVDALSAVARSQVLLADMEVLIAESDLFTDVQKLKNKRMKLFRDEVESQKDVPQKTPAPTTTSVSSQTIKSLSVKKKKRHSSLRKSPVDISSDDTMLIPTIHERTSSLVETSQMSQTSFSLELFDKTPSNKSDSEVSLSSSIKAEFNKPYTKSQNKELVQKSPTKKHKSDLKVESKSKSKHISKRTQSPTKKPKTVADLKKSDNTASNHMDLGSRTVSTPKNSRPDDKNSKACATYVPVSHNMPMIVTQPSMSTMRPILYVNPATQATMQYSSQQAGNSQPYTFYGSQP